MSSSAYAARGPNTHRDDVQPLHKAQQLLAKEVAESQLQMVNGPRHFEGCWNTLAHIGFYGVSTKQFEAKGAPVKPEKNLLFQKRADALFQKVEMAEGWCIPVTEADHDLPIRADKNTVLFPPPGAVLLLCKDCSAPFIIWSEWQGLELLKSHFYPGSLWIRTPLCKVSALMARSMQCSKVATEAAKKAVEAPGYKPPTKNFLCQPYTLGCPWCPLSYSGDRITNRDRTFQSLQTHGRSEHDRFISLLDVVEDAPAAQVMAQAAKPVVKGCDKDLDTFILTWNIAGLIPHFKVFTRLVEGLLETGCECAVGLIEAGASRQLNSVKYPSGLRGRFKNAPVKGCHSGELSLSSEDIDLENPFPGMYLLSDLDRKIEELGNDDRRCASWLGATWDALAPSGETVTVLLATGHLPQAGKSGWREGLTAMLDAVMQKASASGAKIILLYCDTNEPLPGRVGAKPGEGGIHLLNETKRCELEPVHPNAPTHRGGRNIDCCFFKSAISRVKVSVDALPYFEPGQGGPDHSPMVWKLSGLRRLPSVVLPHPRKSMIYQPLDVRGACWDATARLMEAAAKSAMGKKPIQRITRVGDWQPTFPSIGPAIDALKQFATALFGGLRQALLDSGARVLVPRAARNNRTAEITPPKNTLPPTEELAKIFGEDLDEEGIESIRERGEIGGSEFWSRLKNRTSLVASGKRAISIRHQGGRVKDPASLLDLALNALVEEKEREVLRLFVPPVNPQRFMPSWGSKSAVYDEPPVDCMRTEVWHSLMSAKSKKAPDDYGLTIAMWIEVCQRSAVVVGAIARWNTAYFRVCYTDPGGERRIMPDILNVCLMCLIPKSDKTKYSAMPAWRIVGSPPAARTITDGIMARRWQVSLRNLGPQNSGFEAKVNILSSFMLSTITVARRIHEAVSVRGEERPTFLLFVMDITNAFPNQLPGPSRVATGMVASRWQARASHDAKLRKKCKLRIANHTAEAISSVGNSQGTRFGPIDWRFQFDPVSRIEDNPRVANFLIIFGGADDEGGFVGPTTNLVTLSQKAMEAADLFGGVSKTLGCVVARDKCYFGLGGKMGVAVEATEKYLANNLVIDGTPMARWPDKGRKILGILTQLGPDGVCVKQHIIDKCLNKNLAYARTNKREYSSSKWWSFGKSVMTWNVVMSRFRYGGPLISRQWEEVRETHGADWGKLTGLMRGTFSAPRELPWEAVELLCKLPNVNTVFQASICDLLVYLARRVKENPTGKRREELVAAKWAFQETYEALAGLLLWRAEGFEASDNEASEGSDPVDPLVRLIDHDFDYWECDLVRAPIDEVLTCLPFEAGSFDAPDRLGQVRQKREYARDRIHKMVATAGLGGVIVIFVDGGHKPGLAGAACAVFYHFGADGSRTHLLTVTTLAANKSDSWVEEGHASGIAARTLKSVCEATTVLGVPAEQRALWAKVHTTPAVAICQDCTGWISLAGNLVKRSRPKWPVSARFQRDILRAWQGVHGRLEVIYIYYPGHIWEVAPGEVADWGAILGASPDHLAALEAAFASDRTEVHRWENQSIFTLPTTLMRWFKSLSGDSRPDEVSCAILNGLGIFDWMELARAVSAATEAAADPHGHRHCDDQCTEAIDAGVGFPFEYRDISGASIKSWFLLGIKDHEGELPKLIAKQWGVMADVYGRYYARGSSFQLSPDVFTNYSPLNAILWRLFFNLPLVVAPRGQRNRVTPATTLLRLVMDGCIKCEGLAGLLAPLGLDWVRRPTKSAAALFRCLREDCLSKGYAFVKAVSKQFPDQWGDLKRIVERPWITRYDKAQFNKLMANFRRPVESGSYKKYVENELLQDMQIDLDAAMEEALLEEEEGAGATQTNVEVDGPHAMDVDP
jgi:hypothetical protein